MHHFENVTKISLMDNKKGKWRVYMCVFGGITVYSALSCVLQCIGLVLNVMMNAKKRPIYKLIGKKKSYINEKFPYFNATLPPCPCLHIVASDDCCFVTIWKYTPDI